MNLEEIERTAREVRELTIRARGEVLGSRWAVEPLGRLAAALERLVITLQSQPSPPPPNLATSYADGTVRVAFTARLVHLGDGTADLAIPTDAGECGVSIPRDALDLDIRPL